MTAWSFRHGTDQGVGRSGAILAKATHENHQTSGFFCVLSVKKSLSRNAVTLGDADTTLNYLLRWLLLHFSHMKNKKYYITAFSGLLLAFGVGAQFIFLSSKESPEKLPDDILPQILPRVEVKDLPLAETESVQSAINEGLGFSDYRYREYRQDGITFSIYLAYWQNKKRHFLDIGTHAPDNCWVTNGWTMDPKLPRYVFTLQDGQGLWPVESRVFHAQGNTIYAAYWHLLDGEPIDYTKYKTGKSMSFIMDNLKNYMNGSAEQYFIRISSNIPLDQLEGNAAFQSILSSMAAQIPLINPQVLK